MKFPDNTFSIDYIHYYFNEELNWNDVEISDNKIKFLIDIKSAKKRFLIFRNILEYTEENFNLLKKEIFEKASKYKVFVDKGYDEWGFRAKIYMPINSVLKDRQIIIKTCWLISENKKPKLVTAYYETHFERNIRDEI